MKIAVALFLVCMLVAGCLTQSEKSGPEKQAPINVSNSTADMTQPRPINPNNQVSDRWGHIGSVNATINDSGLMLVFDPPLPTETERGNYSQGLVCEGLALKLGNRTWNVIRINSNLSSQEIILGELEFGQWVDDFNDAEGWCEFVTVHSPAWPDFVEGWEIQVPNCTQREKPGYILIKDDRNLTYMLAAGKPEKIGGRYFNVDYMEFEFGPIYSWRPHISAFKNIMTMAGSQDGIILGWEERNGTPKLESIFIPRSSPVFEKLAGG